MPQKRKIYLLDPRQLSPETIAVAFAKTSRSPQRFQEIADELSEESSAEFHEKWVVGYGHSSVAEHAVLHIALENVSRLAVECVESNRLASYTEKSSRYQVWDQDHFYIPPELNDHPLKNDYTALNQRLFGDYQNAIQKVTEFIIKNNPRTASETERAFNQRLRTCCADVCRYYLPASSLANVGMTINARALEYALIKLLSHPLSEVRAIGSEIKAESLKIVPTLVKYANENAYLKNFAVDIKSLGINGTAIPVKDGDWFSCAYCDPDGETRVLAALLFRFGEMPFNQAVEKILTLDLEKINALAFDLLGKLGEYDIPLRELEYASISFDMLLDQGAYFELKRHRMMTQTAPQLTTRFGYAIPALLEKAGDLDAFNEDMALAGNLFEKLYKIDPHTASYCVPNAFNRRVFVQMNLRSALHFIKLRSAPNAHFAIRRVSARMTEEIQARFPLFSKFFETPAGESWQSISSDHFIHSA